ncbi:probable adenylate kinase 7, mitochondrial [Quercus lobata]|uniref:probable adenylate kinase 7, mitochondrial n=1 Tax=Quercus lobata TaxID=97700 RepID=UPI0012480337|nr:probable adenylate kinase 7, mitochondrial [Quercus lobata]
MIELRRSSATKAAAITAAPLLCRLTDFFVSLFHSNSATAAQTQPDSDSDDDDYSSSDSNYYYYYNNRKPPRRYGPNPMSSDSEAFVPTNPVQWSFIGNPSAKRHVFAQRISKLLEVPRISISTLVCQDLNPRSSLYKQIANAVNGGAIVPEDILFRLLSKRLEDGYSQGESGFILDGIPRSRIQAEILDQLGKIDLVVNFKSMEDSFMKHHGEGTSRERIERYAKQSKALEDYYRKQQKLLEFQVDSSPGANWPRLLAALHLKHIVAARTSHKLNTGIDRH